MNPYVLTIIDSGNPEEWISYSFEFFEEAKEVMDHLMDEMIEKRKIKNKIISEYHREHSYSIFYKGPEVSMLKIEMYITRVEEF